MNAKIILLILFSTFQFSSYALIQSGVFDNSNNSNANIIIKKNIVSNNNASKSPNNSNIVSGSVYAGTNKLPKGQIFLLNNNKSTFTSTTNQDVIDGSFQFKNIISGRYILYVIPELNYDFLYFPKYLPTYSGRTYSWQKAISSDISTNKFNVDLHLLSFQNPFYGEKKISGHIKFSELYRGLNDLPVPVILINENGVPMDFRIADNNSGEFSFEYLPEGIYYIHPEIPGLKTADFRVQINENDQIDKYNNVNFLVDEENIKIDKQSDDITPVVSGQFLKIFLKGNINYPVVCELIDLSGKSIAKKVFYSDVISMSTIGMASNMYILKVKTYNNSPIKTAKVFIRNY